MTQPLAALVDLLELERTGPHVFESPSTSTTNSGDEAPMFGGLLAGQALMAAGRTVDASRHVHALTAWFLRSARRDLPTRYAVDHRGEGRSFSQREVVVTQESRAVATVLASFHVEEDGPGHQVPMSDVVEPDSLPRIEAAKRPELDIRRVEPMPTAAGPIPLCQRLWIRGDGRLPEDPLVHAAVAVYATDVGLLDCILSVHGRRLSDADVEGTTLGHSVWFHARFRADEWLLHEQHSLSMRNAVGLAHARLYTPDGAQVVSVVQENLLRHTGITGSSR